MSPDGSRGLRVEVVGGVAVVSFSDRAIHSEEQIRAIDAQFRSMVDDGGFTRVLIDLHDVESIASLLLGPLITLNKRLGLAGGALKLCSLRGPVVPLAFEVAGLVRVFAIYPDAPTALDAF